MYISFSSDNKVTNELDIEKAVDELKRVIQGSLLVDTFDFKLSLSFSAHDSSEGPVDDGHTTEEW